jgi:HEPN domain-containing protein
MKNNEYARDWLRRAKSNLARARSGKIKEEILYEDLCFDCQQAAEKAIKAFLISIDKEFPPTHSIARLLEIVSETKTEVPAEIHKAIALTDYAVKTRYPGESEPVIKEEYEEALTIAETVYNWVSNSIEGI